MSTEELKAQIQEELNVGDDSAGDEQAIQAELGDSQNDGNSDNDEPQLSDTEQRALSDGWVPKDQYRGNPDDWRGAKDFLEFGSLVKRVKQQNEQMRGMQSSFDDRLSNVNALHKGQLESQLAQLNTQFTEAVDDRDTVKAESIRDQQVNVSNQLQNIDNTPQQAPNNDLEIKSQWELDNSWINTNTDKALEAKGVYQSALNVGKSIPEALEMVDRTVAKYNKPSANSNRAAPASVSSGQQSSRHKSERSLSMNDISHQEMQMRGMFKDDKSFLKAVQDSRVGV